MDETRLCLDKSMAKPFLSRKVGDKLRLVVDVVLIKAGLEPDYSATGPDVSGSNKATPKKPVVEFVVTGVNGRGPKSIKELTDGEMEDEIAKTKEGEYEEYEAGDDDDDKRSIWADMKEQSDLTKTPARRRPQSLVLR